MNRVGEWLIDEFDPDTQNSGAAPRTITCGSTVNMLPADAGPDRHDGLLDVGSNTL